MNTNDILPPFKEEGFDPNNKSTYFNEEEYINKIGIKQEPDSYLLASDIYASIYDEHIKTLSFRAAIEINSDFFTNKKILIINSGIGLNCLFSAKAGAKKVFSVEPNKVKSKIQKRIVQLNNYQDVIEVLNCDIEEVQNIGFIDIIICEWMGYFLLTNSLLKKVIYARDKFLAKDGLIFPDKATLYICGIQDEEYKNEKFTMWDNVYDVNMSSLKSISFKEPLIDTFDKDNIISTICPVFVIDLYKIEEEDLNFSNSYELIFSKNDDLSGLASWFDVEFSKVPNTIKFTTSPFNLYTKWKQLIFYLEKNIRVEKGNILKGSICARSDPFANDMSCIDIKISYEIENKHITKINGENNSSSKSENSINEENMNKGVQMFKLSF